MSALTTGGRRRYLHAVALVSIGVYRRRVHASLARIWENVLDWEHLPWLHRGTFASVRLLAAHRDGWRAESALHDRAPFVLDVTIDRAAGVYHSRTVEGAGAGTDIVTRLTPIDTRTTDVAIEFLLPDVPAAQVATTHRFYETLYARLWDEDEAMMRRRQALLDAGTSPAAPGRHTIDLGPLTLLRPRLPVHVDTPAGPVRVLAAGETLVAHAAWCPHRGGPLDAAPLTDGCVTCPWHGYRFDVRTGAGVGTHGLRLELAARVEAAAGGACTLTVEPA